MRYVGTADSNAYTSTHLLAQLRSLQIVADAKLLHLYPYVYYSRAQETTP